MQLDGRAIHAQAEQAREDGDFSKALQLTDQAMMAYQQAIKPKKLLMEIIA